MEDISNSHPPSHVTVGATTAAATTEAATTAAAGAATTEAATTAAVAAHVLTAKDVPSQAIVEAFDEGNVLIRTILSGAQGEKNDVWFDLDQLHRQSKLHGKPYRLESEYKVFYDSLNVHIEGIKEIEQQYQATEIIEAARKIAYDFMKPRCEAFKRGELLPAPSQEEIREKCQEDLKYLDEIPEILDNMVDWIMGECAWVNDRHYNSLGNNSIIDSFNRYKQIYYPYRKRGDPLPQHDVQFYLFLKKGLGTKIEEIKQKYIDSQKLQYTEIINELKKIQQSPKTHSIDMSSKDASERSIREYIFYRVMKNNCHSHIQKLFANHVRDHAVQAILQEESCTYYNGYKLEYEKGCEKVCYPSVGKEEQEFTSENCVRTSMKAISLPGAWSDYLKDIPTKLFDGRKGAIAFGLIGIESQLAIPFRSATDMSSTHSIVPGGLTMSYKRYVMDRGELLQKKQDLQRRTKDPNSDWFERDQYRDSTKPHLAGHTESLVYGSPVAILIRKGYEDTAVEARTRYAAYGLLSPNAPFFEYDDSSSKPALREVNEADVLQRAQKARENYI